MTEDEIIARGHRVRRLLADDDLQAALAELAAERFAEWQSLGWDEQPRAEMLRAEHRAQDRIVAKLTQWADELTLRHIK